MAQIYTDGAKQVNKKYKNKKFRKCKLKKVLFLTFCILPILLILVF